MSENIVEQVGRIGQRCMSEREPELGLGIVVSVDRAQSRIGIGFPATGEQRLYALGTPVLRRVQFRAGDSITTRDGVRLVVASVEVEAGAGVDGGARAAGQGSSAVTASDVTGADAGAGVLVYVGMDGRRVREDALSDVIGVTSPSERLLAGQTDPVEVFDLRFCALQAQHRFRQSEVRGFLGGRLELIPHQMYILHEVASRQMPRVLLADEVGLGKTIEACLILQRLLATGRASRVLVLVPESLTHQWFVELLRRFNLWFSIYDEARCLACEQSDPDPGSDSGSDSDSGSGLEQNPFNASQLVLCSLDFLADAANERRRDQAVAAGWDIVVVDEAHHLEWSPDAGLPAGSGYALVEQLAQRTPGLLLLTATPTQLGVAGHFARLRLLDPHRYADYERFLQESETFCAVAGIAGKIIDGKPLTTKDHAALKKIFTRDLQKLGAHLDALAAGQPGAREALLKNLLDQHGTGRVMFRNTRAAMSGFPKRKFCPAPLALAAAWDGAGDGTPDGTWDGAGGGAWDGRARIAREILAEETGADAGIRYSFRGDPRIDWLATFLKKHRPAKVLLICKSRRKAVAIDAALQEKAAIKTGLFHEELPLVQRDRNAAWFAEPDGAQLLICSEIGSEGRNFQFAHHLVLFDLPLNPGLLEQRIGRLDRIGQTQTIRIHVPYVAGSAEECVVEWYHRGLDAFETSLHGGDEYRRRFRDRLLALVQAAARAAHTNAADAAGRAALESLVADTAAFHKALSQKLKQGRDRLLELNSFDAGVAARVIERIRAEDTDPFLRRFLLALLDHFGVRVKEDECGDVFLDPAHAYVEAFPSIPREGMLATFSRERAIAREDIRFLSADHPLVQDAVDLLARSPAGSASFGIIRSDTPALLLEAIFVLEAVADSRWQVDRFLAPTPVRVLVDVRGRDLTGERDAASIADEITDGTIQRFLERPGFNAALLRNLVSAATARAEARILDLKADAAVRAETALVAGRQRLLDLQKLNDNVRPEEIGLATEQIVNTRAAIDQARLRLDAIRLIVEAPGGRA
ncbi:MAG: RNA polymerase-associated protein RapA [Opitutaceae bacterium]|jgi:ATP-dependent helicase HepA|nr:RNA polymerase-associated protein RapA [Opitutaceae bacterium]